MKKLKSFLLFSLCLTLSLSAFFGCAGNNKTASPLDPNNPTTVTIWNYYNGDQQAAFDTLVNQFNNTIGQNEGIIVVSASQGSIDTLATNLIDSVEGKVGSSDIPSAAAIYPETAYILNNVGAMVPIDDYFSAEEFAEYVPGFLEEGRLTKNGRLFLVPISKSTEAFIVNKTDWANFAAATGITIDSIETYEDLTAAAKSYYDWTDSLTPDVMNDGKSLYCRDSVSNYFYIGAKQLGHELFTMLDDGSVHFDSDKETFRTLWDNYYIPYINGYFGTSSSYRSEDMKTGTIISMTGSTSGITYVPTFVTDADDATHDIEISISRSLYFEDATENISVQQGASFCIMKTTEAEQYATAEFLKWFTDVEQNLSFSTISGYSPVKIEANTPEKIQESLTVTTAKQQNILNSLLISADVYQNVKTYISPAFSGSKTIREIIDHAFDMCKTDRASVIASMAAGASRENAVANYVSDDYFESWYNQLCASITNAIE